MAERESTAGAPVLESAAPESRIGVDGCETVYRRAGSGEPILFLHGAGLSRAWLPFHTALAEAHDVIAPQHPGFGESELPSHFRSFDDYALHYDALLRGLGVHRVHLVATSLGGRIAAHLATFYPERFASLTLIVPAGLRGDGPRPDPFRQTPEESLDALTNGRADRISAAAGPLGNPDDPERIVDAYREDTVLALLTFTDRYDRKLPHRLSRIAAPTLVVDVEEDRVLGAGAAERYADLIPGARRVIVPGPGAGENSSHAVHVEQPAVVADAVLEHLESVARATGEGR